MIRRFSLFNATSLALGFAFLYLPILLLVGLFVQRLAARHRVGRLLDPLVRRAVPQRGAHGGGLGDAAHRLRVGDPRDRSRHARGAGAHPLRALPRPHALHRHGLCADGDAGGDHRPVAAAVLRRDRPRPRLLDHHARAHDPHHVLRHRGGAGAPRDLRPLARGGRDGSRRAAACAPSSRSRCR